MISDDNWEFAVWLKEELLPGLDWRNVKVKDGRDDKTVNWFSWYFKCEDISKDKSWM